jgi:hypothetical protein
MALLLENKSFYNQYLSKGEVTRVATNGTRVSSSPNAAVAWSLGATWGYSSTRDGWSNDVGNGYQYSLKVYPAAAGGDGTTKIVVVGRPMNSTDKTTWRAIETVIRPASLADFQMFSASNVSYGDTASTYGKVYAGVDNAGNRHNIDHNGKAYADLMAEGSITVDADTVQPGVKRYTRTGSPSLDQVPGLATPPSFNSFLTSLSDVQRAAQSGGIYLNDATADAWRLTFRVSGTTGMVDVQKCTKTSGNDVGAVAPTCGAITSYVLPTNGAIYTQQNVLVGGVIGGRVTVVSATNLYVVDNITYAVSGEDVFGMVAQNDVIVARYAPDQLTWRGAALAQSGARHSYDNSETKPSTSKATFIGSTTTYGSPYMNMYHDRDYIWDDTLRYLQPPWFPSLGNVYTIVLSREVPPT